VVSVIAESTTTDALLSYICQHPSDDVARLAYADLLEERGEPDRAEFIRLQIAHEGYPGGEMETWRAGRTQEELGSRERQLLEGHRVRWCAGMVLGVTVDAWSLDEPMPPYVYGIRATFHRGFPAEVSLTAESFAGGPCGRCEGRCRASRRRCPACRGTGKTPGHAAALFRAAPIKRVRLDREPVDALRPGDWWWWEESGSPEGVRHVRCDLPAELFGLLAGGYQEAGWSGRSYPSREEGLADLAAAALLYGRRRGWPCPKCGGRDHLGTVSGHSCIACRGKGHTVEVS
jgi:uncharacterized protein (TIGR02996 family)